MINDQDYVPEAEHSLLATLLLMPERIAEINLRTEQFTTQATQFVFDTIQSMYANKQAIDVITVADRMDSVTGRDGHWLPFVSALAMNDIPASTKALQEYQEIIARKHRAYQAKCITDLLHDRIEEFGNAAISEAGMALINLSSVNEKHEHTLAEVIKRTMERIDRRYRGTEEKPISTGIIELDRIIGGFYPTELYVFGARPAMGKTAFLQHLALNANVPAGIISAEMRSDELGDRFVSSDAPIHSGRIRSGKIREEDWPRLAATACKLGNTPIYINDNGSITNAGIVQQARKWVQIYGIRILYVDYLQRILGDASKRFDVVSQTARTLKELAKELAIPVVALGQVKREVENRDDKRPGMSDLSDSGQIECEADCIATLYRDVVYNPQTPNPKECEIIIGKQRHGKTGVVLCRYEGNYYRFANLDLNPSKENYDQEF